MAGSKRLESGCNDDYAALAVAPAAGRVPLKPETRNRNPAQSANQATSQPANYCSIPPIQSVLDDVRQHGGRQQESRVPAVGELVADVGG